MHSAHNDPHKKEFKKIPSLPMISSETDFGIEQDMSIFTIVTTVIQLMKTAIQRVLLFMIEVIDIWHVDNTFKVGLLMQRVNFGTAIVMRNNGPRI